MTNQSDQAGSFIEAALVKLEEGNNWKADIAKEVLAIGEEQKDFHRKIGVSFFRAFQMRNKASQVERTTGTRGEDPVQKPESWLGFCQELMNRICWTAAFQKSQMSEDDFANGIDFAQDTADNNNVHVDIHHISEIVDLDFKMILSVHTAIAGMCNYLTDIEALYVFLRRAPDEDGNWITVATADSLIEAQPIMQEIIEASEEVAEDDFVASIAA